MVLGPAGRAVARVAALTRLAPAPGSCPLA